MTQFAPNNAPQGTLLPHYYCPVCGDVANVFQVEGGMPEYRCRRGHNGDFQITSRSAREPQWIVAKTTGQD